MKKISTHFLRLVITLIGIGVLVLCVFGLPSIWRGGSIEFPMASTALLIIIFVMEVAAIPFYIGLWQTLRLLKYIDQNIAFSELSIKTLRNIKYCATVITVLYMGCVPLLYPIADADDAPGLLLFGAAIAGAPLVVSVFAAVLEKLLRNALDIKNENDLTV